MKGKSIREEPLSAKDLRVLNFKFSCEDCSHFSPNQKTCTIGYESSPHQKENQMLRYDLNGKIAFCRFIEFD